MRVFHFLLYISVFAAIIAFVGTKVGLFHKSIAITVLIVAVCLATVNLILRLKTYKKNYTIKNKIEHK